MLVIEIPPAVVVGVGSTVAITVAPPEGVGAEESSGASVTCETEVAGVAEDAAASAVVVPSFLGHPATRTT
jgi:hypothetical protein